MYTTTFTIRSLVDGDRVSVHKYIPFGALLESALAQTGSKNTAYFEYFLLGWGNVGNLEAYARRGPTGVNKHRVQYLQIPTMRQIRSTAISHA